MTRLTDNDRQFGPLTIGTTDWRPWRIVFSTGGGDDDRSGNNLTAYGFGWVARLSLPTRMQPWRRKVIAQTWDAATVERMGRNWYYDEYPREYGFCLNEGHLSVFLGAQTDDRSTTKIWSCFLPWTQWRHIRHSLFDGDGRHFYTEWEQPRGSVFRNDWMARSAAEKACPSAVFDFDDHDGQRIQVACRVEEREWRFGTGAFKWLSLFKKPNIRRSLNLEFSSEVGPEKGSWKGGMLGHGIEMLPDEKPEDAFRRYCDQEHRSQYRSFKITFIGAAKATK